MEENKLTPTAQVKYSKDFILQGQDWENIYILPRICTKDNNLKEFQFKILHRYIGTNNMLYKFKISHNNRCRLCNLQIETIRHIFYECHTSYNFWLLFIEWWKEMFKETIELSCKDIIFGYKLDHIKNPKLLLLNKFILIAKYIIFKSALIEEKPVFAVFLNRVEIFWRGGKVLERSKSNMENI